MEENLSKFTVKINDEYCEWEYEFQLSDQLSINDIAKKMCKSLGATKDNGKFVRSSVKKLS